MLEKIRPSVIRFFDHLNKDKTDGIAFYLILIGLASLMFASKKDTNVVFSIFYVFGVVSIIRGTILSLEIILSKKLNIKILTGRTEIITYVLLIVKLFSEIITPNYSSGSYILAFIIIVYSIRNILFSIFMFSSRNQTNIPVENKKLNAMAYSFGVTCFLLLTFGSFDFLFFKVFILFLVYGIYYLVREKYLLPSIKSPYGENTTYKKSIFSHVWDVNFLVLYILLLMFLLFYYNVLTLSEIQPTVYYFYSTSAQVFAALLGIIVMFSILILQNEDKVSDERNRFLKKGLVGFTILYIIILILSFTGIVLKDTVYPNSIKSIPEYLDINMFRDILSVSIFEFVFLMIPAALLYLYAMISDFLNWDATFEVESGSMLHVEPDNFNAAVKGANRITVVVK